jgi:hypothetical protein
MRQSIGKSRSIFRRQSGSREPNPGGTLQAEWLTSGHGPPSGLECSNGPRLLGDRNPDVEPGEARSVDSPSRKSRDKSLSSARVDAPRLVDSSSRGIVGEEHPAQTLKNVTHPAGSDPLASFHP